MNRPALAALTIFFTLSAFAVQEQPAQGDATTEWLARELYALNRIAGTADDLGGARKLMLEIIDSDIEKLRGPKDDGTYQWASLQREEGGKVTDEKSIEYVHTEKELRNVTVTGANGYRAVVTVPKKRGTFSANNRVWVRNILVDSTGFDGKTTHHEIPVNAWVNPGDSNGVALPDIGKSVKVTAELGVEKGDKAAVAEVGLIQAKLVDDPNSPYFPAAKRLLQIREIVSARDINRGQLKTTIDEALLSLPGELAKRTAEMEEAARVRRQMAESGTTTGSIAPGDATPDVVAELAQIGRLMAGTLQEQADARTRLGALLTTLKPKTVE